MFGVNQWPLVKEKYLHLVIQRWYLSNDSRLMIPWWCYFLDTTEKINSITHTEQVISLKISCWKSFEKFLRRRDWKFGILKKKIKTVHPKVGNQTIFRARFWATGGRSNLDKMFSRLLYKLETTCRNVVNRLGDISWNCLSLAITEDLATMPLKPIGRVMMRKKRRSAALNGAIGMMYSA